MINIITVNIDMINRQIEIMENMNNIPSYLIMNEETLKLFKQKCREKMSMLPMLCNDYPIYRNIPIAVCNKLRIGEVEII